MEQLAEMRIFDAEIRMSEYGKELGRFGLAKSSGLASFDHQHITFNILISMSLLFHKRCAVHTTKPHQQ